MSVGRTVMGVLLLGCGLSWVCTADGDPRLTALSRLRFAESQRPVSIDDKGGLEVVWWEVSKVPLTELRDPNQKATMYYRRIACDGREVVGKERLTSYRWAGYTSVLKEGNGNLLVTWTLPDTGDDLHWLVVYRHGQVVDGPGAAPGLSNYRLVRDSEGAVYGVGQRNTHGSYAGIDLHVVKVYPDQGDRLVSLYNGRKQDDFGARISSDFAVAMTSDDDILVCARPARPSSSGSGRNEWKNDEAICVVLDLTGQIVLAPERRMLHRDGFRKIPDVHLGGWTIQDTKAMGGGIDLTAVQGGQMVLSLNSYDPQGQVCVCQARFSPHGGLVTPDSIETVKARRITVADSTVRPEVGGYRLFKTTGVQMESRLCIYGFDVDGNFYWDTQPWILDD